MLNMSKAAAAASASAAASMEIVGVVDVPSGFRFLPRDLELVRDYLCKKITNRNLPSDVPVVEYDIYSTEPWNLPVNNRIDTIRSNRSYYFVKLMDGIGLCRRKRIVNPSCGDNGVLLGGGGGGVEGKRRGGGGGCWKRIAGGRDTRYIRDESYKPIGIKKSFAFHAYLRSPPHSNNINTTTATTSTTTNSEDDVDNDGTTTPAMTTSRKTNWIMDEYSLNTQRSQPWVLCVLRKEGGGEEKDDEILLLSLQQVQQQEQKVYQPDHDLPYGELEILEKIKTIQEKIRINQIHIWDDQYELRELNEARIYYRLFKQNKNVLARGKRFKDKWCEYIEEKATMAELEELLKQNKEEQHIEDVEAEKEAATIRAGSYYQVQLPSRFRRKRRRSHNFH